MPNITSGAGYSWLYDVLFLYANLNSDARPDELAIELWPMGPFSSGFQTGTFQLTGAELNYKTCAVCVLIHSNTYLDANGDVDWADDYMATGGTLTLSSVDGSLVGTLTNATFEHVNIATGGLSTPVGDGCTSSISSASFNSLILDY